MTSPELARHFRGLWRRAQNEPSLDGLTPELVSSWTVARGLEVEAIEERDVGAFAQTRSIILTIAGEVGCLPKAPATGDPAWERRRSSAERTAALWSKMEWFAPLWVSHGEINALLKEVAPYSGRRAIETFDYHFSTIYTLPFQAVCIAQLMPRAHSLREFSSLARESYLAFHSGFRASSIAALIPAIEGSLTRITSDLCADAPLQARIDRVADRAIALAARLHYRDMWVPEEYLTGDYLFGQDERVFVFETFRRWLQSAFFRRTDDYAGETWLNRHMFAHATTSSWQQTANFKRLVVALATLGVMESWHDESNQVSLFFPEMDKEGELLWQQALFCAESQSVLKMIEARRYQKYGRLVPELPTDDGVLLRKAVLVQDCINDLVRPLREAGWSVQVDEPDEQGLYMALVASSGEERFGVALLYSCGTDPEIYRKLATTSSVILYLGAPYHQDQFARGIDVHVGPVTGWQPPRPQAHSSAVTAPSTVFDPSSKERTEATLRHQLQELAYALWEDRGRPLGDDWTDWLAARQRLGLPDLPDN